MYAPPKNFFTQTASKLEKKSDKQRPKRIFYNFKASFLIVRFLSKGAANTNTKSPSGCKALADDGRYSVRRPKELSIILDW